MNEKSCCNISPRASGGRESLPLVELALLIGLPVAVLVAGAVTTAIAMQDGFTPAPEVVAESVQK